MKVRFKYAWWSPWGELLPANVGGGFHEVDEKYRKVLPSRAVVLDNATGEPAPVLDAETLRAHDEERANSNAELERRERQRAAGARDAAIMRNMPMTAPAIPPTEPVQLTGDAAPEAEPQPDAGGQRRRRVT